MWINDRCQKSQNGSAQDERFRIDIQLKTVGKASIIESKIVPNHTLYHYILKPKDVLNELERNTSKIIWLKGLLRIPFPYLWLLKFLTNKCGMESTYRKSHMNGNQC